MSDLLSSVPKRKRILVEIVEDGCAKTFIYKDVEEDSKKSPKQLFHLWFSRKKRTKDEVD